MIVVGFSKRKGFAPLSWLIMWCEGTNFSHAYIKFYSRSLERELIYQATGSGVHFVGRSLFEYSSETIEEYEITIPEDERKALLQWCVDNAGKPYGYLQLIGIAYIRLMKVFGKKVFNPFSNGDKAYVCCELVVAALEHLKLTEPSELDKVDLITAKKLVLQALDKCSPT